MLQSHQKKIIISAVCILLTSVFHVFSQELYPIKLSDKLWHNEQRELRYHPEGTDFVITNGTRLFTRALYGTHTAFRVETGDKPEFGLFMPPGMAGNFKFGLEAGGRSIWLTEAKTTSSRYRAGTRIYNIEDPIIGTAQLTINILALSDAEGFVIKTRFTGLREDAYLIWTFGGASNKSFSRNGDMGTDPESSWYLTTEGCKDNSFTLLGDGKFTLKYGAGLKQAWTGTSSPQSSLKIADASNQTSPAVLYQSSANNAPVLAGKLAVSNNTDYYFEVHNPAGKPTAEYTELTKAFNEAERVRLELANRISIKTPDPYINTIGGTLAIAADAIWEEPTYLHGAIGWRSILNGWRGPYTGDALGWHDRAKMHFESYSKSQMTSPATGPVMPDTSKHLARGVEKPGVSIFTSGYISPTPGRNDRAHHYDMNLVTIDELLRHYAWTGDVQFLKQTWPVVKRHLEWETRNFDADRDGLYDAYAAIWASDALQYSGGGVTHSSAYNYYAFKKAAEIATLMGEDPAPYRKESEMILKAMNAVLWMPNKGSYAEYKDLLGNKLLHPAAALWTIYHSMDSETMDPFQAYQSMRYIDTEIPHIPVKAKGLDDKGYYTLSTTNWMPYTWSLNNVALAESMHTILANWQAGRADEAFKLFKSEILASMYLGGSPGNIVQISHYDAIRGEAYRDFGDPIGMFSRALVEGLFGIVPDALNKQFTIRPGMPSSWNYASFSMPNVSIDFNRTGTKDKYLIIQKFSTLLNLKLQVIAQGQVKSITVNGKPVTWENISKAVGKPIIEINAPATGKYIVSILWFGEKPTMPSADKIYTIGSLFSEKYSKEKVVKVYDPQETLSNIKVTQSGINGSVTSEEGNHTVFVQLSQGALSWWSPVCFKVEKAIQIVPINGLEANNQAFRIRNSSNVAIQASVKVNDFSTSVSVQPGGLSEEINVPKALLVTGTNTIIIDVPGRASITGQLIDWSATNKSKVEMVDISSYFNDKVTQIFKNKYLTPRPQVNTLQLPWQGAGAWTGFEKTYNIDDIGLRQLAGDRNQVNLPQGVNFITPGNQEKNNILFTSQWDNYPKEFSIPLSGHSGHAWMLMAGSTNTMQSQLDNGEVIVDYTDGTNERLALRNPETWWPIQEDYFTDDFAFTLKAARPVRIHLKTGAIVSGEESKAKYEGKIIDGGAATILDLPLNASKQLKNLSLRTLANDVVIGLMGITLER